MNKRQAKKAYKKKYGYNPPKNWQQSLDITFYNFGKAMERAAESLRRIISKLPEAINEATKNIQAMPEEDFNKLLENEDIDQQQRALLLTIRAKRKGAYNHDSSN